MRLLILIILPLLFFGLTFSGSFDTLKKVRPTPIPTPQNIYTVDASQSAYPNNPSGSGNPSNPSGSGNPSGSADPTQTLQLRTLKFTKHTPMPTASPQTCSNEKVAVNLVIDTSTSMTEVDSSGLVKMNVLKQAVSNFVTKLTTSEDVLAIQQFNYTASVVMPFTVLPDNRDSIIQTINNLQPNGNTNFDQALTLARSEITIAKPNYSDRKFVLILLSDGVPTAGNTNRNYLKGLANQIKADNVRIITIGLGTAIYLDTDLLSGIATTPGPPNYFLSPADKLDGVYNDIAASLCL